MSPEDEELYDHRCAAMSEEFEYLVDTGELSRMPTREEMDRVKPILRKKIEDGEWGDTTQELAAILCSVSNITTTLEP